MTEKELQDAANKLYRINKLKEDYKVVHNKLQIVNKRMQHNKLYSVSIRYDDGDAYRRPSEMYVNINAAVVQQQLVTELNTMKREIIALGGVIA